jgi:hypothetical protein
VAARHKLEAELLASSTGDTVVLDAAGVDAFDISFAGELIVPVVSMLATQYPGRFLVLEHLNEVTRENAGIALELRGLAVVERRGRSLSLLGKVAAVDQETFVRLSRPGQEMTAPELAHDLGLALTAANERLAKLVRLGLTRKSEAADGSRAFRYTVPT